MAILAAAALAAALAHPFLLAGPAHAAGGFDLRELLSGMAAVGEVRAEFVERKTLAVLDQPLLASGTLRYRRPDFLERITRGPSDERMTVTGDRLTLEWPSRHTVRTFALSANPALWATVEAIRATLAGDRAALERFYWTTLSGDERAWTLRLEPRAAGVTAWVQSILLAGGSRFITRVEVQQANGDRSVMDIRPA